MNSLERAIFGDNTTIVINGSKYQRKPIKKQFKAKRQVRQQKETSMASEVSKFLGEEYPTVIYRFDVGADVKLSLNQATKFSRLQGLWSTGYPDLFIAFVNKYYAGLYLELKADGKSPYKLNGELKKDKHLENQERIHQLLRDVGYEVKFVTGLKEAKDAIEEYMECVL